MTRRYGVINYERVTALLPATTGEIAKALGIDPKRLGYYVKHALAKGLLRVVGQKVVKHPCGGKHVRRIYGIGRDKEKPIPHSRSKNGRLVAEVRWLGGARPSLVKPTRVHVCEDDE